MGEYIVIFFVLLAGSVAFYLVYERYFYKSGKPDSSLYVQALQELLDGKAEQAFGNLRQVVADDSSNVDAYLRLGQILRNHGKPDQALQVHKDLTLRNGLAREQKAAILRQLVADYMGLEESDTAQAALRELIILEPQSRWAHARLLEVQKAAKNWEEAYDTAARILKMETGKSKKPLAAFKYNMGRELHKKREYRKARILFKEALGLDPGFVSAYLSLGDSYYEEGRREDAVNFWNKLIAAVPEEGYRAIERLKRTLFDLGRFGDIVEICESILKHKPRDLVARLTLAEFHEKKGDLDLAAELLIQVVEDEPDNLEAVLHLIRIYLEKGDNRRVEELLRDLERRREKRHSLAVGEEAVDTAVTEMG